MLRQQLRARLPPVFPSDKSNSHKNIVTLSTLVRLVRHDVAQLVAEGDEVVLYHCAGNSCRYHQAPEGRLAFPVQNASALEHLIISYGLPLLRLMPRRLTIRNLCRYPSWTAVGDLPMEEEDEGADAEDETSALGTIETLAKHGVVLCRKGGQSVR